MEQNMSKWNYQWGTNKYLFSCDFWRLSWDGFFFFCKKNPFLSSHCSRVRAVEFNLNLSQHFDMSRKFHLMNLLLGPFACANVFVACLRLAWVSFAMGRSRKFSLRKGVICKIYIMFKKLKKILKTFGG